MILNLGCIVEGEGEVQAVPVLARRIVQCLAAETDIRTTVIRVGRYSVVKTGQLERYVDLLARKLSLPRAVLILLDADDSPPCVLGPELLARARVARADIPAGVVLANREYEAWFLAAIDSIAGHRGLLENLPLFAAPESIRNAKGELTKLMKGSKPYSPLPDQPALTAVFDLKLARSRSPSFDKCWRETERLLAEASQGMIENVPETA